MHGNNADIPRWRVIFSVLGLDGYLAPVTVTFYKIGEWFLGVILILYLVFPTEVTIFADKVCVDEELVRLHSHIETTKSTLMAGGSIGRKLDFLAQEMNREANTILSKSNDLEISNCAIELKTEIEKVREQIQNIE